MRWRKERQPTPVFLPGESQGWGSLMGCCLWGSHRVGHDRSDLAAALKLPTFFFFFFFDQRNIYSGLVVVQTTATYLLENNNTVKELPGHETSFESLTFE